MKDKIFLLSIEEYEKYKNVIPHIDTWWWLKSPCTTSNSASLVFSSGGVCHYGDSVDYESHAVRPALRIDTSKHNIGDKIVTCGYTWIVIDTDLVISEMPISFRRFDEKSNDYENSEIRKFLLEWYEERREL